jgi:hypothetical protein
VYYSGVVVVSGDESEIEVVYELGVDDTHELTYSVVGVILNEVVVEGVDVYEMVVVVVVEGV